MELVYNRNGVMRYLVNPGLEIEFDAKLRRPVDTMETDIRFLRLMSSGGLIFRNSNPSSAGIDWMVLFYRTYWVGKIVPELQEGVPKNTTRVPHGTRLHEMFVSIFEDGSPPEPFLDLLTETHPDLQDLVDKYLRES